MHCNNKFKFKSKLDAHFNVGTRCHAKYLQIENKELKHALEKKELEHALEKKELELENQKLKNELIITNNSFPKGIIIQNNTINVNVNVYGQENIKYITPKIVQHCLERGAEGDILMFKLKHLIKNHPENHNIKMLDLKNNKITVLIEYKNDKKEWRVVNKEDIISDHLFQTYNIYLIDMKKRGKDNVTDAEIRHLKAVGEPTHNYKKIMEDKILPHIKQNELFELSDFPEVVNLI